MTLYQWKKRKLEEERNTRRGHARTTYTQHYCASPLVCNKPIRPGKRGRLCHDCRGIVSLAVNPPADPFHVAELTR